MISRTRLALFVAALCIAAAGYYIGSHRHSGLQGTPSAATAGYTCAMHPFVEKDRPGACPVCGMDLVRRYGAPGAGDLQLKEHVYLSPAQQVMANLSVVNVMYKPLFKEIRAAGAIAFDQSRQGKASAWVAGRIRRLHADTVGAPVRTDQPVAELDSVELIAAEEEYLALSRGTGTGDRDPANRDPLSPRARAWQRLRQLGFSDAEFSALERSGKPDVRIPIYPPLNGVVTTKDAQEGQFVKTGDTLIGIADLSHIWAELEVYEDEFPYLRTGQQVALTTRSYPGSEFAGRITFLAPFLDPRTKTVRVRVAVPNPQLRLKPDMLVDALIQVPLGTDLAVPAEAVVVTGDRSIVWVQTAPGVFVPRAVRTGARYRDDIQVLAGLKKDEVVAASGAYLIDSEAQLGSSAALSRPSLTDEMDMSNMTLPRVRSSARSTDTPRRR
jgi:membrane fusion protein, copper/silver efflux system